MAHHEGGGGHHFPHRSTTSLQQQLADLLERLRKQWNDGDGDGDGDDGDGWGGKEKRNCKKNKMIVKFPKLWKFLEFLGLYDYEFVEFEVVTMGAKAAGGGVESVRIEVRIVVLNEVWNVTREREHVHKREHTLLSSYLKVIRLTTSKLHTLHLRVTIQRWFGLYRWMPYFPNIQEVEGKRV